MPEEEQALERRIRQFEHYLGLMHHRAHNLVHGPCFLIFSKRRAKGRWPGAPSKDRFVQFSFERDWFCMDLPNDTLASDEVQTILDARQGFFFLRDRPEYTLHGEHVEGFDPFRKVYPYREERAAALDTAYIFFSVWMFPVGSWLKVQAAAFGKNRRWERDFSVA